MVAVAVRFVVVIAGIVVAVTVADAFVAVVEGVCREYADKPCSDCLSSGLFEV